MTPRDLEQQIFNDPNAEEKRKPFDIPQIQETLTAHEFVYLRPIGQGGFASVFLVLSTKYQQEFVVKVSHINSQNQNDSDQSKNESEISNLFNLNHTNIIKMYQYFKDNSYSYIILEYCKGGSLENWIKKNGRIHSPNLYEICYQMLISVKYCHDLKISHGDIKPGNFLIGDNSKLKLADFGLSHDYRNNSDSNNEDFLVNKNFGGSKPYMAPELFNHQPYNPYKVDIWALGVSFYQISIGCLPWNMKDYAQLKVAVNMGAIVFPRSKISTSFAIIIRKMLEVNPHKRATLQWILEQPIFNNLSFDTPSIFQTVQDQIGKQGGNCVLRFRSIGRNRHTSSTDYCASSPDHTDDTNGSSQKNSEQLIHPRTYYKQGIKQRYSSGVFPKLVCSLPEAELCKSPISTTRNDSTPLNASPHILPIIMPVPHRSNSLRKSVSSVSPTFFANQD